MRSARGFTLIELMITVAIVAVLAAIAVPSYTIYITRSKIAEATTNLSDLRVKMEQFYQDNRKYNGATAGTCGLWPLPAATVGNYKYFTFTCASTNPGGSPLGDQKYTITATGSVTGGDQTMTGFTFTINEANARATTAVPSGWTAAANCWVSRKSGSC
ncbi:MAG: prepilin-type N-terminal cleavage/methylation domain-containing protein [Betaproteobacteria bacterium]|nr:MAG: prepilin-type N-terminal cleavage/methylation domain-containing protein [Betaproteobacteria bacterium]